MAISTVMFVKRRKINLCKYLTLGSSIAENVKLVKYRLVGYKQRHQLDMVDVMYHTGEGKKYSS